MSSPSVKIIQIKRDDSQKKLFLLRIFFLKIALCSVFSPLIQHKFVLWFIDIVNYRIQCHNCHSVICGVFKLQVIMKICTCISILWSKDNDASQSARFKLLRKLLILRFIFFLLSYENFLKSILKPHKTDIEYFDDEKKVRKTHSMCVCVWSVYIWKWRKRDTLNKQPIAP